MVVNWKMEWKSLAWIVVVFLGCFFLPVGQPRFDTALLEAFHLVRWYSREHVLLCLIPAFFIAGAIGVFVSKTAVMKYLGPGANRILAYGVAAVSGTILAVCSCTILPLFAGIYRMGAGLGPATAFLYSGPAINVLAIVLTASVLGPEMGLARGIGAVAFSVIIGLLMSFIFRNDDERKTGITMALPPEHPPRALWQNGLYFLAMVAILVFANWGRPQEADGLWASIYAVRWWLTSGFGLLFGATLVLWFNIRLWKVALTGVAVILAARFFPGNPEVAFAAGCIGLVIILSLEEGEAGQWLATSWDFAKQILPLLLIGVLIAGALLGRVGHEGLIPSEWVTRAVGGNSLSANFFAAFAGAFMYFATLTEVPILQGLIGSGMGKGPALALLLSGPALSLPNMLVIRSVLGVKKTLVFVILVVLMATVSGSIYGSFF